VSKPINLLALPGIDGRDRPGDAPHRFSPQVMNTRVMPQGSGRSDASGQDARLADRVPGRLWTAPGRLVNRALKLIEMSEVVAGDLLQHTKDILGPLFFVGGLPSPVFRAQ
jgi:hypothetical protein